MSTPLKLTEDELLGLRGLGEQLDLLEVEEVYLPLARLIHLQVAARQRLFAADRRSSSASHSRTRTARCRSSSASRAASRSASRPPPACCRRCWPAGNTTPASTWSPPTASSTPTPSSLRRNLMHRKGFPESYDRRALMRFVTAVKSGADQVCAPVYSHLLYDIVPGEKHDDPPPRHPDPRGPQRPADRARR